MEKVLIKGLFTACIMCVFILSCQKRESYTIEDISNNFGEDVMFPNVYSSNNELLVSYIKTEGDTFDQLFFSKYSSEGFSDPVKISEGNDWFVNWADIPAIAQSGEDILVSWLDKSAEGTYDYDIKMKISNNGGKSWGSEFIPHKDGKAAEHGFVSLDVNDNGDFVSVWLDGRNTRLKDEDGKDIYGQMTLRGATIKADGNMIDELEIDERVCDCCQTAVLNYNGSPFVVYRDRSENEIRDIYFSIFEDNEWTTPVAVHDDEWEIAGCPVNGPVIEYVGGTVIVSWYTEGNGKPELYIGAYNSDSESFGSPVLVSDYGVIGRTDILKIDNDNFMVVWLEDGLDNQASIKGKVFDSSLMELEDLTLGYTLASRESGFPKVSRAGDEIILIYTQVSDQKTLVTKRINLDI